MKSDVLNTIADTLLRIVTADMTPKQLIKAVRKQHPNASKKRILRAALLTVIANARRESALLHDFVPARRSPVVADTPEATPSDQDNRPPTGSNPVGRLWSSARR